MSSTPIIFWFRRDLRLSDNPALTEAVRQSEGHVAAVFIVDHAFVEPAGPTRVAYLRATLHSLDNALDAKLNILVGDPGQQLVALATAIGASEVVATGDFAPKGRARDELTRAQLAVAGVSIRFLDSPYAVLPGTLTTKTGSACRVFSAYRRGWDEQPVAPPLATVSGVEWRKVSDLTLDELSVRAGLRRPHYFAELPDGVAPAPPKAGEGHAHEALGRFSAIVDDYGSLRDIPGVEGTSRLSPFLRFGALHPRQILHALNGTSHGREVFRSELCWREFYADVLWHNPDSVWRVLQPSFEHLRVDRDERAIERFRVWARGETGFPLVDAGMRQLLEEGWMHNRVRMVAASFLVKHLHLDWRWGARWFMWRLCDGDVASNQHGWQWTAGTGTDAAPFHRIFNPTLQAERFDPHGDYVRRFVPELASVPAPDCLRPGGGEGMLAASSYAAPMLDLGEERGEALARFAEVRSLAKVRS